MYNENSGADKNVPSDPEIDNNARTENDYDSSSSTTCEDLPKDFNIEQERTVVEISDNQLKAPEHIALGHCTIKEILSEILDCTIVNKPPSTSCDNENSTERTAKTLSILFPPNYSEGTGYTMKEIFSRILDCTVHPSDQTNFSVTGLAENMVQCADVAGPSKYVERNNFTAELGTFEQNVLRYTNPY